MKKKLIVDTAAILLISLILFNSFAVLSPNVGYAQGSNITFTTGETINFSSTTEMTFRSTTSFKFGTNITIQFFDTPAPGDGIIQWCDVLEIVWSWPPSFIPPICSWWEVIDPITGKLLGEFHVDATLPPNKFHVDIVLPGPIMYVPTGLPLIAKMKVDIIQPCEYYVVHEPYHWWMRPCTWIYIIDPETGRTGYCFHVDWTNESCEFHIDSMKPGPYRLSFPSYEVEGIVSISKIELCDWFEILEPTGLVPDPCSWWEILDPSGAPTGLEFHVDQSGAGTFHVDQVRPDPLTIPWAPTETIRARKKIISIWQCEWFKVTDPTLTPESCSWWKLIYPNIGDVEFHVDVSNPDGTFHIDLSTAEVPFPQPVDQATAERKIETIQPCDWFKPIDPPSFMPEPCSWWIITLPQQWAGVKFHVDSNDGTRFHVDKVDGQPSPITPWPYSVTAEPYQPAPPPWYVKPPYPDYAPSGMPDFDERQDDWWWRSWAFPDAVAVWQHWNGTVTQYGDWDIYYSIYTDPNMWWTLGTDYARPIVQDSLAPGPALFLLGNDTEPAISWYSSNYAICVWQHWNVNYKDWDIWYSMFTPNIGWTWPAPVWQALGEDLDPVIAFDTNGYAVCVWRHQVAAAYWLSYSIWNPATKTWGNQGWVYAPAVPTPCLMPEVCVDSKHNIVVTWTDPTGPGGGTEKVWFSWAAFNTPIPPPPAWSPGVVVLNCPMGIDSQKGISPDNLGNNLLVFSENTPPPFLPVYYAQFTSPSKTWTIKTSNLTNPTTDGEGPDIAFDLNNNAIAVYTKWAPVTPPAGELWYSFWNGVNWQPVGGAKAAATGNMDQFPAITFLANNKAVVVWQSALNTTPAGSHPPTPRTYDEDIFFSVYTPPYPPGSWTNAAFLVPSGINQPNGGSISSLRGNDRAVDIASPTGSPTTPPSVPPDPPEPAQPYWTWCGPLAVANSIWWFDSKYEPGNTPPPAISDGFSLVRSYNPGVWDDHDPQNVQPFVEHLAYLMDCDGMRTKLCHDGTFVWDMQAGITHYLSWSGVNPLGDVDGDGDVDNNDKAIVNAAMGSKPGQLGWNLAADIWPETVTGPYTADNVINANDLNLVNNNLGKKGMFYEHTTDWYPDFYYLEDEIERCQDVVLLLAFHYQGVRDGGHFVTVAGVNSTTHQFLISNPIRDDFEAGLTPGRSPVPHWPHPGPEPPYTTHNNASLVSQDAYTVVYNAAGGYWYLEGYFTDPAWEARIECAVITSPYEELHDIAVTSVLAREILNRGDTSHRNLVNVTVLNEGTVPETFDVSVYAANTTDEIEIGRQTVMNLPPSATTTLNFPWNTDQTWVVSAFCGNYTVRAYAWPVLGETHLADNNLTDGEVILKLLGDLGGGIPPVFFDFDGKCEGKDLDLFLRCFKGTAPPEAMWLGDLGGGMPPEFFLYDGKCEGKDLSLFLRCFRGEGP